MSLFRVSKNLLLKPSSTLANAKATFIFDKRFDKGPHHIDHATGNEKLLLILEEKGFDDPFQRDKVYLRGPATKDNPCLIPSWQDKRVIGCICQEDQTHVCYMWVHKSEMKRCECGHWFKCVDAPDLRQLAYGKVEDAPEMY